VFIRHFSLLAIATVCLFPNLVQANEIARATQLSDLNLAVGDMQIVVTECDPKISTPEIQMHSLQPLPNSALISRTHRRVRTSPIRYRRSTQSTIQQVHSSSSPKNHKVISQTSSSTIRSSDNSSQVTNRQQQSIQCSADDNSTVSQSTSTTLNGRTVRSEVSNSCK
jgi:hypothetical protein